MATVPLPIPPPQFLRTVAPNEATVHLPSDERKSPIDAGFIFPVDKPTWKSWEEENILPDPQFSCRQMELMVFATVSVGTFVCQGSVSVDTGCRVPLLFRKGLIPEECLEQAQRPIKISTADGTPMSGGNKGCIMWITIPVTNLDGTTTSDFHCEPFWGYEAAVESCDLVMGYPFLKKFRLVVDCPSDSLRRAPTSTSGSSGMTSTSTSTSARCSTPMPKHSTPVSTLPTTDFYPGVKDPKGEGSTPVDSPGPKTKAAEIKVNGKSSSRLVLRSHRFPERLGIGCSCSLPPALSLFLHLPDGIASGVSVENPPTSPQFRGDVARTTPTTPPIPFFRCSQCLRKSSLPDFDCGCMSGEARLLPVYSGQETMELSKVSSHPINISSTLLPDSPGESPYFSRVITFRDDDKLTSASIDAHDSQWFQSRSVPVPVITGDFQCSHIEVSPPLKYLTDQQVEYALKSGNYRIRQKIFDEIMYVAYAQVFSTTVDAFSCKAHRRMETYWSAHSDAFERDWSDQCLWINPPMTLLPRIVEKIYRDGAKGIIIFPVMKNHTWFHALACITFFWWDIPEYKCIFEDPKGTALPSFENDV